MKFDRFNSAEEKGCRLHISSVGGFLRADEIRKVKMIGEETSWPHC